MVDMMCVPKRRRSHIFLLTNPSSKVGGKVHDGKLVCEASKHSGAKMVV